ncbi:amidophosphoribosyltransferase, partial [Microgenomates group bacterium]|nr:amidophosphoribosyltransferase [Microgenomates group bacterium]
AQLIKILKAAGVKAVHVRVASPPFKNPCYLGIDVSRYSELIAGQNSVETIRKKIKADSLGYLSIGGLKKAIGGKKIKFCTGCFNNQYPI